MIKLSNFSGIFQPPIHIQDNMFDLIFALVCIVPNVYLFLRFRCLFIGKKYRIIYALIYLLVVLIYPVNLLLIEENYELKYNIVSLIARYILPYYLYVALLMLLYDLFLLINWPIQMISVARRKSRTYRITALSILLLVPIGIDYYGIVNFNTIRTSEYQITIPKKSSKIDHLKIAFVADFHLKMRSDIHFVERFAAKIAEVRPDLMIFGGDIVEGNGKGEKLDRIAKIFRGIQPKYGVFAVLGNHESFGVQARGQFFDKAGMKMLCDSIAVVDHAFSIAGRYDNHYSSRKSVSELLKSAVDSLPLVLVDHRPTDIVQASKTAADIQFSGHTHDGQLFPFNLIIDRMYPMKWGYTKIANTNFFLTSGIMLWGPPVRTVGKSEIVVVEVDFR